MRAGAAVVAVWAWSVAASADPLSVVASRRYTTNVEDSAFVDQGTYKGRLVLLDGDELRVMRTDKRDTPVVACNVHDAGISQHTPRGLAYVPTTDEFVVHDQDVSPFTLVLFRQDCTHPRTVSLQLDDPDALYIEGIDFIPRSSPHYPGMLAIAVNGGPDLTTRYIAVVALDGTLVARIVPTANLLDQDDAVTGLAYIETAGHARFLVSTSVALWEVDFDGSTTGPTPLPVPTEAEAIAQDTSGAITVVDYAGDYVELSKQLVVRDSTARNVGASPLGGVRIRTIAHAHGDLITVRRGAVTAISDASNAVTVEAQLPVSGLVSLATLGASSIVGALYRASGTLYLVDEVSASADGGHALVAGANSITYADSTDTYVASDGGSALHRFDARFNPLSDLDLSTAGVSRIASVSWRAEVAGPGTLCVLADGHVLLVSLDGVLLSEHDLPANVTLQQLISINDGPFAGQVLGNDVLDSGRVYRFAF